MVDQVEMTPEMIKEYHSILEDPDEEKNRFCVRIERGPFAGLGVAFGRFQMADKENEDGTTGVRFEYDFIDIPPDMVGVDFEDGDHQNFKIDNLRLLCPNCYLSYNGLFPNSKRFCKCFIKHKA